MKRGNACKTPGTEIKKEGRMRETTDKGWNTLIRVSLEILESSIPSFLPSLPPFFSFFISIPSVWHLDVQARLPYTTSPRLSPRREGETAVEWKSERRRA